MITAQGAVMALAFRCKVDTQQREVKKWEFVVSHNGISRKLTFEVEVFPTIVPEAGRSDHKYINWFNCKAIATYHHIGVSKTI